MLQTSYSSLPLLIRLTSIIISQPGSRELAPLFLSSSAVFLSRGSLSDPQKHTSFAILHLQLGNWCYSLAPCFREKDGGMVKSEGGRDGTDVSIPLRE